MLLLICVRKYKDRIRINININTVITNLDRNLLGTRHQTIRTRYIIGPYFSYEKRCPTLSDRSAFHSVSLGGVKHGWREPDRRYVNTRWWHRWHRHKARHMSHISSRPTPLLCHTMTIQATTTMTAVYISPCS